MKMLWAACIAMSVMLLSGCEQHNPDPIVGEFSKSATIHEVVRRGKRLELVLKVDQYTFHVRVKRCGGWRQMVGKKINVTEIVRQGKNSQYSDIMVDRYVCRGM